MFLTVFSRYQSQILMGIHMYSFRGVQSGAYFFLVQSSSQAPLFRVAGKAHWKC